MRLCGISSRFQLLSPCMRQVTHALLTRPPLSHKIIIPEENQIECFVRLACVKHAASVHPEPGSNSHVKKLNPNQNIWLSKSETSSYRNLDSGFTVFKVCFIKSCSFIFWWLELFSYESFKVIHCSVINVLCCFRFVQATYLLYHSCFYLSITFSNLFFQIFLQIVLIFKTFIFCGQDRMLP